MTTIPYLATLVCSHFQITKKQLRGRCRKDAEARKWLYYLCKINGIKEKKIAWYVRRDRSTVNDVFSRMNRRVDRFKSLQTIKEKITGETKIN